MHFKIGKLYVNTAEDTAWPLFYIERNTICATYLICGWLEPSDLFVPIVFVSESPHKEYEILCKDGTIAILILSRYYIEETFREYDPRELELKL